MSLRFTLSKRQYAKLADICADMAQISAASISIPFFLDTYRPALATLGVVIAVGLWIMSVVLSR